MQSKQFFIFLVARYQKFGILFSSYVKIAEHTEYEACGYSEYQRGDGALCVKSYSRKKQQKCTYSHKKGVKYKGQINSSHTTVIDRKYYVYSLKI